MMRKFSLRAAMLRRSEDGAAAIEFAIIAVPMILLLFGIIGYGFMFSFRQALSQGAAEAARVVVVSDDPTADEVRTAAVDAVNQALGSYGVTCDGGTSNLLRNGADVGDCRIDTQVDCPASLTTKCVEVELSYEYRDNPIVPTIVDIVYPPQIQYQASSQVNQS